MLTAIVLVCAVALSVDLAQCNQTNASDVLIVPASFASPVVCLFHGQAYLAALATGSFDTRIYRAKVICTSRSHAEGVMRQRKNGPRFRRLT